MTQFIRPPQAYAAVASYVAQGVSTGSTDLEWYHRRITDTMGVPHGTWQYGTIRSLATTQRSLAMPDLCYSAIIAANPTIFSDALYNSSVAEGAYVNTSEIMTLPNDGLCQQIIFCIGDSITNSKIGAGVAFPEFSNGINSFWAAAVDGPTLGAYPTTISTIQQTTQLPSSGPQPVEWIRTNISAYGKSRWKFNYGHDSWRLANQAGFNYQTPTPLTGSPHNDNTNQFDKMVLATNQQLVIQIFCGTNDIAYADSNSNPGLSAVPAGTLGYTYAGSPNYFTDCLIPFITLAKALYPTAKIMFIPMAARGTSTSQNGKFVEVRNYAVANKAALGIDLIVDTVNVPHYGAGTIANSADLIYYQSDRVHFTPIGIATVWRPILASAYDKLQGYAPDPAYASLLL